MIFLVFSQDLLWLWKIKNVPQTSDTFRRRWRHDSIRSEIPHCVAWIQAEILWNCFFCHISFWNGSNQHILKQRGRLFFHVNSARPPSWLSAGYWLALSIPASLLTQLMLFMTGLSSASPPPPGREQQPRRPGDDWGPELLIWLKGLKLLLEKIYMSFTLTSAIYLTDLLCRKESGRNLLLWLLTLWTTIQETMNKIKLWFRSLMLKWISFSSSAPFKWRKYRFIKVLIIKTLLYSNSSFSFLIFPTDMLLCQEI